MAQVSFETAKAMEESRSQSGSGNYDFFTLKNDGDEAIVRIMHDSTASFPIFTVHNVNIGGKPRKIGCIRDPRAPLSECPLCNSGNKVSNRFFIEMIVYSQNEQGQMVGRPAVWERSLAYATKLKSMLDEYGPLSECLFKVKRNGAAGSTDTTYEMFFCNPKVYRDDVYKPMPEAFKDVTLDGTLILNKSASELQCYVDTGSFPVSQVASATTPVVPTSNEMNVTSMPVEPAPEYQPKSDFTPTSATPVNTPPWDTPTTTVAPPRPNRYY